MIPPPIEKVKPYRCKTEFLMILYKIIYNFARSCFFCHNHAIFFNLRSEYLQRIIYPYQKNAKLRKNCKNFIKNPSFLLFLYLQNTKKMV